MPAFPLADHFVCLDTGRDSIWVSNAIAARVWVLSEAGQTAESVAHTLSCEYDVDYAVALHDTRSVLQSAAHDHDALSQSPDAYVPVTDFVPGRSCNAVATAHFYLPGYCIVVESEVDGVVEKLSSIFSLPKSIAGEAATLIKISVFDHAGTYPIVYDDRTGDTGFSIADVALKTLREVNGILTRQEPYLAVFHASALAWKGKGILEFRVKYLPPIADSVCLEKLPCHTIVLPDYSPSHATAQLVEVSRVEVFEQFAHSGCYIERPFQAKNIESLISWLNGVQCVRLSYSDLASARALLLQHLEQYEV